VSTENQTPITIRDIVNTVRELSAGFTITKGENFLHYVHVDDLAAIYVSLFADAAKETASDVRLWGPDAYYFATSEELSFVEYMREIVKILREKGVISTDVIMKVGPESDDSDRAIVNTTAAIHEYGTKLRVRSSRAETLFGWKEKQPSVKKTLPEIVKLILSRSSL
jgi:nucleoside-diphosphate-sugar epimerase